MQPPTGGPGSPFPPTLMFVVAFGVGLGIHEQQPLTLLAGSLGAWRTLVGVGPLVVGLAVFWWGMSTFARARTGILLERPASRLVTTGPYRWSRNPMYVGLVVCYIGLSVLWNSIWPIVFLPAVLILLFAVVIGREERYLRSTFGREYDAYCERVGRWVWTARRAEARRLRSSA